RSVRLERTQGRRNHALSRLPRRFRAVARRRRSADHAGTRQRRLDQRGRYGAATDRRACRDGRGDRRTGLRTLNDECLGPRLMIHSTAGRAKARAGGDGFFVPPRRVDAGARFCGATGEVKPVDQMIRFVLGPDGAAVPDLRRRLPGRGIWITATRQALGVAIARKAFTRGFKRNVRFAPDFLDMTERLIERAALDALAIIHKAGTAAIGFSNVDAALTRARVVALLNAAEASPHGRKKLLSALRQREDF